MASVKKYFGVAHSQMILDGDQSAASAITIGASPFSYTASIKGFVNIQGGTVSAVDLVRNGTTTNLGTAAGNYPVSNGDKIIVTYSVVPTAMKFVPN